MGLSTTLNRPYYAAESGSSALVPGVYDVSIDGHPYMVDTSFEFGRRDSFRHSSIPATRTATDITNIPGEGTINTQGLWRREIEDWSLGAGQRFFDRNDSFANRFRASKGVDVFTNKWYASLLKDTTKVLSETDTALQVLVVGSYVYALTSTQVRYSSDLATWHQVAGLPNSGIMMMATDGYTVYIACGTGGLYTTTAGSSSNATHYLTGSDNLYFVAYCSNALFVAKANSIYNITTTGSSLPTALMTQNDANWTWNSACGGYGWIYLGGYSGSFSAVYGTQMLSDGTALSAPVMHAPLPPGEIVHALFSFVNFILVGTSQGMRYCQTLGPNDPGGSSGDLKVGPIIPNLLQPVTRPVYCFTAQNRFVWFGWSNYDSGSTGLGKLDVTNFTGTQTPAYASDLMASAQGDVTSLAYFNGSPIFSVSGVGLFSSASTYVSSGTIESGYITFGIPDQKVVVAYSVDVVEPLNGSIGASVVADDGISVPLGTTSTDPPPIFSIPQTRGELFETTLTINAGSSNTTTPTIRRATLQGLPTITAGKQIIVAIRLYESVMTRAGRRTVNCDAELNYLENLRSSQKVVAYQQGSVSWQATVTDIDMVYYERTTLPDGHFNGLAVVTLQTLGGILS